MEVVGERLRPVVDFPAAHIARADHRVDFVGGDHLPILGRDFGGSVGDVEVPEEQH